MRCLVPGALLAMLLGGIMARAENPLPIESANVLPLAIDDAFEFRKVSDFSECSNCARINTYSDERLDDRLRTETPALGSAGRTDVSARTGQYFTFFWRAKRAADITLRLEYRQANLKNYVQARELNYPNAKGSHTSEFAIVGNRLRNRWPDHLLASDFDRGPKNCGASSVSNLAMNST